ncbi:tyrosine-type recombinase/integrase [Psychroserpens luteus]
MKSKFSEPKIFTGGVDISKWSKLTKKQQEVALKKDWYVYYSFRNPETNKLNRQINIKGNCNSYSTKSHRLKILKPIQRQLHNILEAGFNPYSDDNSQVKDVLVGKVPSIDTIPETTQVKSILLVTEVKKDNNELSIDDSVKLVLKIKQKVLNENSYPKFKSRINRFFKWLQENDYDGNDSILSIKKKTVIQYLNSVLQGTSARNRNNARIDIGSFFQTLEDNDVISENFIKKINILKSVPKRNKTYKPQQQKDIYKYMEQHDPILLLFVKFISYNFLRPIEVCRLRIEDVDLIDKKLYVKAKNKAVKIKIIPNILISSIPNLSDRNDKDFIFTPTEIGGAWDISEANKRDYFTKRFKKVKDYFKLGVDYGLYSFRHTFITMLYREFAKGMSPYEVKSKLMLITGHNTMEALEKYLRDIDAALPDDYSKFLK